MPPYRRDVNTVFQDYALFPHMTVGENVAYGPDDPRRGRGRAREARAREALALVKLAGFEGRRPRQLSGGQRQRVALARALVNEPKVLLLDEPLGALDLKLREQMQDELKALQRKLGITFVFVTHDQGEALAMADRLAVFNEGRIVQIGAPAEVYERPRTRFVADFVGSANVLPPDFAGAVRCGGAVDEPAAGKDPRDGARAGCVGTTRRALVGTIANVHYQGAADAHHRRRRRPRAQVAAVPAGWPQVCTPARASGSSWPASAMHPMDDEP